jgi:hypothetical protein
MHTFVQLQSLNYYPDQPYRSTHCLQSIWQHSVIRPFTGNMVTAGQCKYALSDIWILLNSHLTMESIIKLIRSGFQNIDNQFDV